MSKIVCIGLGKMGLPLATHLVRAGHDVIGIDRAESALTDAARRGLSVVTPSGLAAVVARAQVVISSLPNDEALRTVAYDLADCAESSTLYIDTSTVSASASAQAAQVCSGSGIRTLRVALSGNSSMAESAQLTILASGARSDYEAAEPLLSCWGPKRYWLGEGEQARVMKLVVNLMVAHTAAMLAEAIALGQRGGLSWEDLWLVIPESAVGSPLIKAKAAALPARDYSPTFTVDQMLKDLALILDQGEHGRVPLPLTAMVSQSLQAARAQGDGSLDYAALIRVAERACSLVPETRPLRGT